MLIVVSDTSPVRALAHLQQLELLHRLFAEVLLPPAVAAELRLPPAPLPAVDVDRIPFLHVRAPAHPARVRDFLRSLDPGEAEALALAEEVHAHAVLIDEAAGRAAAKAAGLHVVGTLGVLLRSKQGGMLPCVTPLLDRLQSELGFFISQELRRLILQRAGE